ncbi:hypothetical protein AB0K60_02160 [Thermopolyspora sp. NPDC052614]|uniref:hypothetical protein n=1 Tax=Thermopolyspora sp. NPDC052614 TaxID=3155682 RepID=UPI00341228CD
MSSDDDEGIELVRRAYPGWKIWKSRSAAGEVPHYYASRRGETRDGKTPAELWEKLTPGKDD